MEIIGHVLDATTVKKAGVINMGSELGVLCLLVCLHRPYDLVRLATSGQSHKTHARSSFLRYHLLLNTLCIIILYYDMFTNACIGTANTLRINAPDGSH